MQATYDPFKFISQIEIFTIAIIGSFVTMKFLNSIYDNVYEPIIDNIVDTDDINQYYIKIGKYYVQGDTIIKEFIKWLILIIVLMFIYNLVIKHWYRKKQID